MNKILKLFDKKFVLDLFNKKVLPKYPDFQSIEKIEIDAPKNYVWEETYHVVIEYKTTFLTKQGGKKKLYIYCTAHSDEPRKNVFTSLKFLWDHGFGQGYLTIPHPLFYSDEFKGTFYRGAEGKNLYYYIRNNNKEVVEEVLPKAAEWFAKLHVLKTDKAINFNKANSRIKTVFPGINHIYERIDQNYSRHLSFFKKAYTKMIKDEEEFLNSTNERWLTHGDAHPENVIRVGKKKIALIDFTDLCLSDFARDLGTFLQQLEFMSRRKIGDGNYIRKNNKIFLDTYLKARGIEMDDSLQKRIDNYYNWTAMRTATYFLLKANHEPERAYPMIENIKKNLNI